jgi:hypothetical protein
MELDTVFGIPAHPLFAHAAVVLVPLAAVAAVVAVAVRSWRAWLVPVAFVLAGAGAVSTALVQESGEPLEERIEDTRGDTHLLEEHTEEGEQVLPFAAGFAVLLGGWVAAERVDKAKAALVPVVVLSLLAGTAAVVQVTRVGHSGAKAAWDDVLQED